MFFAPIPLLLFRLFRAARKWRGVPAVFFALFAFRPAAAVTPYLRYTSYPGGALAGSAFSPQPVVKAINSSNAVDTTFHGPVSLAIRAGSGTSGAGLGGTATVNAVNGVATFSNLSINLAGGGYVLRASATGYTGADSAPFSVGVPVLYVRAGAAAGNDGSSWAKALPTVAGALDSPLRISKTEVWVAAGMYPEWFRLPLGSLLYGGFAGTETTRAQRNVAQNAAILQGVPGESVVDIEGPGTATTIVDGFTIQGGNTGVECYGFTATIRNNRITGNGYAVDCYDGGAPVIESNTIIGNRNGILVYGGTNPIIRYNTVDGNQGTGISVTSPTSATIINNVVRNNAGAVVGGILCGGGAFTVKDNVVFNNVCGDTYAGDPGAPTTGGLYAGNVSGTISNNTVIGNSAFAAGGIALSGHAVTVANNIVAFNASGIYKDTSTAFTPSFYNNCVFGNANGDYAGLASPTGTNGNISADPQLTDLRRGDVHIPPASPCRDTGYAGAAVAGDLDTDGQPRVQGSRVDIGADESDGTTPVPAPPLIVRVSPSGDDAAGGAAWPGKRHVQAAVDAARGGEIWAAAGTYAENVALPSFTEMYGGFAGSETARGERDAAAYPTIISAAAPGDVVALAAGTLAARVDGFTLQNATPSTDGPKGSYGSGVSLGGFGSAAVSNNILRNNAGFGVYGDGAWTITGNTFTGNGGADASGTPQGGAANVRGNAVVTGNVMRGNLAGLAFDGALALSRNTIAGNAGLGVSGAVPSTAAVTITANTVTGNGGGGLSVGGTLQARQNVVTGNTGAGFTVQSAGAALVNNTIAGNDGDGIQAHSVDANSILVIANTVLAFNQQGLSTIGYGAGLTLDSDAFYGNLMADYAGHPTPAGNGNVTVDPQLADLPVNNIHLLPASPLRDAGDSALVAAGETDVDGQARIQGTAVDIGADESDGTVTGPVMPVIRVSMAGDDAADGSAWPGKRTVGAAVDAASAAGGGDVWVAAGTYPSSIHLGPWTRLLGGFQGSETGAGQRSPATRETVLDGGGSGSAASTAGNFLTLLDGFTIRNGAGITAMVNGISGTFGGGVACVSGGGVVSNNVITACRADYGGGAAILAGSAHLRHNAIQGNTAGSGGGVYAGAGTTEDNTVEQNRASASGGGVFQIYPGLINANTLRGNTAALGGGLYLNGGASNSVIYGNTATTAGGGAYVHQNTNLLECTIADNTAPKGGGVEFDYQGSPLPGRLQGCIVAFNSSGLDGTYDPNNLDVFGNGASNYSGADFTGSQYNISADPLFVDSAAGDYHLRAASPAIDTGDRSGSYTASTDRDGQRRPVGPQADIGAYEFTPSLSMADAVRALRLAAGLSVAAPPDAARLDADGNGEVDIVDAARAARKSAGLDASP